MIALRFIGLALVVGALGACSDESKVKAEIRQTQAKSEFSDFKSITPEEYAHAMDEWMKPMMGSRGLQASARETVSKPQFNGAKFYSIQAQVTNGYGNPVKSIHYCSILRGAVNCQVTKTLTSLEDAKRGAQ